MTLYCVVPVPVASGITILVLLLVVAGLLPRYVSWLHYYISVSLAAAIDLPDGGDHAAVVVSLWIAFASLGDGRTWHWQRTSSSGVSRLAPLAFAGHWALRLQVAYIYLNSGIAKIAVEAWQDGTALYYVTRMEFFGGSGVIGSIAQWATSVPVVTGLVTWGAILFEIALGVMILGSANMQRTATMAVVIFHLLIFAVLGLFSFALIMIGAVVAATAMAFDVHSKGAENLERESVERLG